MPIKTIVKIAPIVPGAQWPILGKVMVSLAAGIEIPEALAGYTWTLRVSRYTRGGNPLFQVASDAAAIMDNKLIITFVPATAAQTATVTCPEIHWGSVVGMSGDTRLELEPFELQVKMPGGQGV